MCFSLTLASLICGTPQSRCQTSQPLRVQIEKLIRYDTDISLQGIPGFIVGIIDGDSSYVLPFGVQGLNSTDVLTENDVFEIGSLTKVMTAHILLKLYEKQLLEVDDPLNKYLPPEYQNPSITATLRDVLMHHAGLPKIPETIGSTQIDMDSLYSGFSKTDLLSWYRDVIPGALEEFRYSHAGYALLELVIENVTDESYAKVFDRYIAEEYGLQNTHALQRASFTAGHDLAGRKSVPWSFQSFRGSEGAQSCLSDLMIYVYALLEDNTTPLLWDTYRPTGEKKLQIAPGWYRFLPKKDFPVYVHSGRTAGYSVMIAFSRKTQTGVIILANSSTGTDDLGLLILRMINKQWRRGE